MKHAPVLQRSRYWKVLAGVLLMLQFQPVDLWAQAADTSFTMYSAYRKIALQHPEAAWPSGEDFPDSLQRSVFVYDSLLVGGLSVMVIGSKSPEIKSKPIVMIHGGGWASGNPAMHEPLALRLAQKGFTVFLPGYRLSGVARFPAAAIDLLHLIRWMDAHASDLHIQMDRLIYAGFSAGGTLASLIAQPRFQQKYLQELSGKTFPGMALIDIDGTLSFVHPESTEGDDSKKISAATRWLGCARVNCPTVWEQASPLFYSGADSPPTLFVNSGVPGMHAGRNDYIQQLQKGNVFTRVIEWADAPHTFCLFHPWLNQVADEMARFVEDADKSH